MSDPAQHQGRVAGWTVDEHLAFDIGFALPRSPIKGLHRALKEDERKAIATGIVEHLKLCGWKFQMTPIAVGHGTRGRSDMESRSGAVLNGLFTLAEGVSEKEFFPAFEAFYQHLANMGFVRNYRMIRRQPLEGFGAPLPNFDYHVEIEFPSLELDQACYDYVKKNEEPVRSLHQAMNSKVKRGSAYFFLGTYI